MFKSKCCNADVKYVMSPDFIGDNPEIMRVGTFHFRCEKCGMDCDIDLLEELGIEEWSLKIKRTQNGYILEGAGEGFGQSSWVVEDDDKDELKSHQSLLWEVMEYFGFGGSKHDKERIRVIRQKNKEN